MCSLVTTPQVSQVLRERPIGMLTAGMSTRAVTKDFNVNFSTISCLQSHFRELGSTSNQPHNRRPRVWRCVGEWFADVNIVNGVSHGGGGVMVLAGVSYEQQTQLHFIDGNFNTQRYLDEILKPIGVPFIHAINSCFSMIMHGPKVAMICTQFLETENVPVFPLPAYSPDMSPSGSTCTTGSYTSHQYPATLHSH
jgi:hypothetical protein